MSDRETPLILVVDDQQEAILLLTRILERAGYHIISATNGKSAMDIAQQKLPDLILTDVQMPNLNGFEVLKALRENPLTSSIPIIILTARSTQASDIVYGLDLGANDYIIQPFNPRELIARVANKLKQHEKEKALKLKTSELEAEIKALTENKHLEEYKSIFISYRRDTSRHLAQLLFQDLRAHDYDTFLDVNTIDSGRFNHIILNQIAARAHFILILSQGSLLRCVNETDWLRREFVEAIRLERNIIPVFDEGFNLDEEKKYLPESIRESLQTQNGLPYSHFYHEAAMKTLRDRFLKQPTYVNTINTPLQELDEVNKLIEQAEKYKSDTSNQ